MTRFEGDVWICDVQYGIEMKSSGSQPAGNTTTTVNNTPWSGQQPMLQDVYNKAQTIGNTNLSFPDFQTYAGPTQQQQQAVGMETQRALNGSPITAANNAQLTGTLNGSYLNGGNPGFQNMVHQVGESIAPQVDSHFSQNGRYGSGANANAFASSMANAAGTMAYQNYNNERDNQLKASLMAPNAANQDYTDISALNAAGAQQQGFDQLPITQRLAQFQFGQDSPYLQANREAALVGGAIPGGGTTSSPYFNNPSANAMGMGLGALGAANTLFGSGGGGGGGGSSLYSNIANSSMFDWGGDGSFMSGVFK